MKFKEKIEKLKNNTEFKKIIVNMNWLFLDKGIQMAMAFFVGVLVIRYLGPEQYGVLSYAVAVVAFFGVFSKLGLDALTVRELVAGKIKREKLLGTVFYLKLCGGFVAVILSGITASLLQDNPLMVIAVMIISFILVFQSTDVIDYWFQSRVVSKHIAYSRSIASIISAVIKVWLIATGASLILFIFVILLESIFVAIGFAIAYYKNKHDIGRWMFDMSVAKRLLRDSWPLILSGVAVSIALRVDQIMIGKYIDFANVGIYAVGVTLAEVFVFIPIIMSQSIFPKIINIDFKQDKKLLIRIVRYIFYVLVGVSVAVNFVSEATVLILFGESFLESHIILDILIWTIPITYLGIITNKLLLKNNNQKIIFIKQVSLTVINIILNLWLIPKYGIIGAACATLIADIIINMLFDSIYLKTRWIFYLKMEALFFIKIKRDKYENFNSNI